MLKVAISSVRVDPTVQPRTAGIDPAHVRALAESAEDWPPLVVVGSGNGFVLVDGAHRFAAAQDIGRTDIDVTVVEAPPDGDLRSMSFELNRQHGRALTLTDRREEAARQLRRRPDISDREIGRQCGLAQPTVAKIRAALEAGAQIEQTTSRVGRGGYQYDVQPRDTDSGPEAERRRLAAYLVRLATTLERSNDYPAWTDAEAAAEAFLEFCEDETALEIIEMLGRNASDAVNVANYLGWEPDEEAS